MTKADFDAKLSSLNTKITSNENELKKLQRFDLSYFRGKNHFEVDGTQNYLVFQPIIRYSKVIDNTKYISSWKSKVLSDKTIKPPLTSDNCLLPLIDYLGNKIRLRFNPKILKQQKPSYTHSIIVNIYTVYELCASGSFRDDPTLNNSLFGAGKLKMLILRSTSNQGMKSDLIGNLVFHFQVGDLVRR